MNQLSSIILLFLTISMIGESFLSSPASTPESLPEGPIVGGISEQPKDQFDLVMPSLMALEREMDGRLGSPYIHRVYKVKELRTQIVAGIRFLVKFEFGQTKCLKNATKLENIANECTEYTKKRKCEADIWEQAWIDKHDLINFKCK